MKSSNIYKGLIYLFVIYNFTIYANCQENMLNKNIEKSVDSIFNKFLAEDFYRDTALAPNSGWVMTLPSGKKVSRSFLRQQADTIISIGSSVVPELFKWVMHDNLAIRYIAIYSLQKLTDLEPYTPYFDREDTASNRKKAIEVWSDWWKKQVENKNN